MCNKACKLPDLSRAMQHSVPIVGMSPRHDRESQAVHASIGTKPMKVACQSLCN